MTAEKTAAIWARVSTEDKQEPSLESQVATVRSWLEDQGYSVPADKVVVTHWTSKRILACPDMHRLLEWVRCGEVQAVGMLHLDRLACRMGQMGQILDAFTECGVELLAKNSPLQGGLLGEAMAMVITIAKALQVERADEGSREGPHNRARLRGLPTTCQAPYGYRWDESRTRLVTTTDWQYRGMMLKLFLEGKSINAIRRELHDRAVPSPSGLEWWPQPTIWGILVDTVNFGEYRALRRENTEPKTRRGKRNGAPTYGNTSSRRLPGIVLPNIVVEKPIITREEYDWMRKRLEQNRANARRNAKHDFLLKGMVYYELDGRRYQCRYIRNGLWAYVYPDNGPHHKGHPRSYINGRRLEEAVETMARELLTNEAVLDSELGRKDEAIRESIDNLESELRGIERRSTANLNAETQMLLDKNRYGQEISDEAFRRALARLQAERIHIEERREGITRQLEQLRDTATSMVGLKQLRARLGERLDSRDFSDRRGILEALGTRVTITADSRTVVDFTVPREIPSDAIAFNLLQNACPRYSVAPAFPLELDRWWARPPTRPSSNRSPSCLSLA